MNRIRVVLAAFLVSLAFVNTAQAHHIVVRDGNSERGVLDVKRVTNFGGWNARWRIDTYHAWSRGQIWDQGYLLVFLDTFGSNRHDYFAMIYADAERMRGTLFRDRQFKSDYPIRNLRVARGSRSTASVTVPLRKLRIARNSATYNWYAETSWSDGRCWQVCFDFAPNTGSNGKGIEEPLPLSV